METPTKLKLLLIGASDGVTELVVAHVLPDEQRLIKTADDFMSLLDESGANIFHMIVVGALIPDLTTPEIAQALRGIFQTIPIFYCHDSREQGFDRKDFRKNGFTDAFFLPMDKSVLISDLENVSVKIKKMPAFRPVRVMDIQGAVLDFDLFVLLPANKKYVRYATAGKNIEPDRFEKLKARNVGSVFVPLDQMPKFYDYAASRLKALTGNDNGMSETERKERLQSSVRDLMSGIFNTTSDGGFSDGKAMMSTANEIIKSLVVSEDKDSVYAKILKTLGDTGTSYSHLSSVSTFAALFSIVLKVGKPEDLALAGLFHDLGLSLVPDEIQMKSPEQWTKEERAIYEKHPESSANLVKDRKLILPEIVYTMIFQHHERLDGSGYPAKVSRDKIKPGSQILAIADEFEDLTRSEMGKVTLSPLEAVTQMKATGQFNNEFLNELIAIFPASEIVEKKAV